VGYNTCCTNILPTSSQEEWPPWPGVLFSYFLVVVGPPQLNITTSTMALLMVIIGSTSVFWGPVVGAVVVILFE